MWEAFKSNTIYTWIIVVISIECGIIVIGLVWFYVRKHQVNKIKTKRREENASLK